MTFNVCVSEFWLQNNNKKKMFTHLMPMHKQSYDEIMD